MAARVLLQRRSMAPLATLAALGGMALVPATVLAEAPSAAAKQQRKPIYDPLDAPLPNPASQPPPSTPSSSPAPEEPRPPRGPTPTDRLAVQVGRARMFLYGCAVAAEDRVNTTMDSALDLEQSFTNTIASLAPPRDSGERLMPGAIYVLVAAMAGSIVARNRNIIVRASLPLALGFAAGWAVVPLTMRNVSDLAWKYEQRFPTVADSHLRLREGVERGVSFAKVHSQLGVRYVDDKVTNAREIVEGWVKQGK
ncbi:apolipoprotein O domain-containing protein [Hirsutella rhossiliensis]|uniref:MICOS complex subunit n=1 Tax=Hirsutella rhossiliensis TaxID=111463 RepID=A0A9P8SHT8_9HYPO|nr:apolipoprotein O domain-containing protein [Hirsutella rhossiliensis]KAH0963136.1 apolipoprotein O domain-containing protein [Hirsutella rhossiliensis]